MNAVQRVSQSRTFNIGAAVAVGTIVLSLLGVTYSVGQSVSSVSEKLDRNCRTLNTIQADVRFLIVEHETGTTHLDGQFRQIFQAAGQENC